MKIENKNNGIQTLEEAVQLANEIERLEATLKQMKEELKAFVETHGEVSTDDKVWAFSESISWQFDANSLKEFCKLLVESGKNPWEILSISAYEIKKLEKEGFSEDVLGMYAKPKITKRFGGKKI